MTRPLNTAIIGFGMIGAGFAADPVKAGQIPYATHAQVLADHPGFEWRAVVDARPRARAEARDRWGVPAVAESVDQLPGLRAVLVEKPLGRDLAEARAFVETCRRRGLVTQVNFWRRGDDRFRELATGGLVWRIGRPRAAFGLYGNGLHTNGVHLIDFIRMLLGEVTDHGLIAPGSAFAEGPIPGDRNPSFYLVVEGGLAVMVQAIPFGPYREVGLDIWGERGRLGLWQEGLGIFRHPRRPHRNLAENREIASDEFEMLPHTCGYSLYRLYDNLAEALESGAVLWSPAESALITEALVDDLMASLPAVSGQPSGRN
jgi:predicted dehydrogenase